MKRDKGVKILINSCISEINRINMRLKRKRSRRMEDAISKFIRSVTMELAAEDNYRSSIVAVFERLETVR